MISSQIRATMSAVGMLGSCLVGYSVLWAFLPGIACLFLWLDDALQ